MATDRHQAPSYPLRMPDDLKARMQAAADASGRSLHSELLHRLQRSLDGNGDGAQPGSDLTPTIVRMERDIAKLEMEKAFQTLTVRMVASAFRPVLENLPKDQILEGPLDKMTVGLWKGLCDAYIRNNDIDRPALEATFERFKSAEGQLRTLDPPSADPIWELMNELQAANQASPNPKTRLMVGNLGTDKPSHMEGVLRAGVAIPPQPVRRRTKK